MVETMRDQIDMRNGSGTGDSLSTLAYLPSLYSALLLLSIYLGTQVNPYLSLHPQRRLAVERETTMEFDRNDSECEKTCGRKESARDM